VCELRLRLTGPGLQIPDLGAHLTQLWGRARTLLRARGEDALQLTAVAGACEGSHGLCAQHIDVFVLVLVLLLALALWSLLLRANALEDIEEFAVGALAGQCRPTLIVQGLHLVVRFLLQVCSARGENLVEATVGKTLCQRLPGPVSELLVDLCLLRVLVGRTQEYGEAAIRTSCAERLLGALAQSLHVEIIFWLNLPGRILHAQNGC